ncbi:MAG: DNA mismatch repair protein MutS, partial [Chitinivibrionales bacterium]
MAQKTEKITPMMKQYFSIKEKHPDTVLLYRMGDFYETFLDDAKIAADVLGLTLTSRNHGGKDATPLAGFPVHALDRYSYKLVQAGYKIAICEQTEDPAKAKKLVKRDVTEIVTAGTATDDNYLDEKENNYIISVVSGNKCGLAVCDITTGEFYYETADAETILQETERINPSEILLPEKSPLKESIQRIKGPVITDYFPWKFDKDESSRTLREHFKINSLEGIGISVIDSGVTAAGALLSYIKEQKKSDLSHISSLLRQENTKYALLDPSTIRNLELLKPMSSDETEGTLISILDRTSTSVGSRKLKKWITHPLNRKTEIEERFECVEWMKKNVFKRNEIELLLKNIADLERITTRVSMKRANARDIKSIQQSLENFPEIIRILKDIPIERIQHIQDQLHGFEEIKKDIEKTIVDSPPLTVREGGFIKEGVSDELNELQYASRNGKEWIASLQEKEREHVPNLKVGYNKVFGYYIEVTKANQKYVPERYIRKQTLTNAERYITPELKDMEAKILGAQERLKDIEYEIFLRLRDRCHDYTTKLQTAADALAELDVYIAFAKCAEKFNYVRPEISETCDLEIQSGRHPVIEAMNVADEFITNDTHMNTSDS